jgi:hypothetical protein
MNGAFEYNLDLLAIAFAVTAIGAGSWSLATSSDLTPTARDGRSPRPRGSDRRRRGRQPAARPRVCRARHAVQRLTTNQLVRERRPAPRAADATSRSVAIDRDENRSPVIAPPGAAC